MIVKNNRLRIGVLVIGFWIISSNVAGFIFFQLLLATHQIKYVGILNDPKLPLVYALGFEYTEHSLLYYFAPTSTPLTPAAGFNDGIFIAYNPQKASSRPGLLTHELRHTLQQTIGGPLEMLTYWGWGNLHKTLGYSPWESYLSNPFERDCYRFSGELAKYDELIDKYAPRLSHLKMTASP